MKKGYPCAEQLACSTHTPVPDCRPVPLVPLMCCRSAPSKQQLKEQQEEEELNRRNQQLKEKQLQRRLINQAAQQAAGAAAPGSPLKVAAGEQVALYAGGPLVGDSWQLPAEVCGTAGWC